MLAACDLFAAVRTDDIPASHLFRKARRDNPGRRHKQAAADQHHDCFEQFPRRGHGAHGPVSDGCQGHHSLPTRFGNGVEPRCLLIVPGMIDDHCGHDWNHDYRRHGDHPCPLASSHDPAESLKRFRISGNLEHHEESKQACNSNAAQLRPSTVHTYHGPSLPFLWRWPTH